MKSSYADNLGLDIIIQQLMLFQQLLKKLDKFVTLEILNHNKPLKKLEYYGIRGITNSWFQLYLNDRIQFTTVNNCQSSKNI